MYGVIRVTGLNKDTYVLRTDRIDYIFRGAENNATEIHYIHIDGIPETFLVTQSAEAIKVMLWQLAQEERKR